VHGIGGVGKSTLLRELLRRATAAGTKVVWLSTDLSEARPRSLLANIATPLGLDATTHDLRSALEAAPGAIVVLDAFEAAAALEPWLLDEIARTNAPGLVVVGSRDAPSARWASPHLDGRFTAMELSNFDAEEAATFLKAHDVPESRHEEVRAFTRGHPLALAVLADLARAAPDAPLRPSDSPNALRTLLETLVGGELAERERATLEAAVIAPRVTEPMLAAMLEDPNVYDRVRWLQSRPYVSAGPRGLAVHDLVRDVVAADLRWRNAERYERFMMRAYERLSSEMETLPLAEQHVAGAELMWLVSRERGYSELVSHQEQLGDAMQRFAHTPLYLDELRDDDVDAMTTMVERFAGPESARVCRSWLRDHREGATVVRCAEGKARGLWLELSLWELPAATIVADPATSAIAKHVRRMKLGRREAVVIQRFYLDAVTGRDLGPTTPLSPTAEIGTLLSTARLSLRFLVAPRTIGWAALWAQLGYTRIEACSFEHDGVEMGVWQLDLRKIGASAFVRSVFAGMMSTRTPSPPSSPPRDSGVDRDFLGSVRAALRAMRDPIELSRTPLAQRAASPTDVGPSASLERAEALRSRVSNALDSMSGTARGERWKRAIVGTYIEAPASQEEIAERLGMPFRTYRDHLTHGVQELARRLLPKAPDV